MNPLLRDMPLFVEVAKHKSFSLAAENLDMYTSTLSRRIAQLEKDIGLPLFSRTTRHVELTDSGKTLYKRCLRLLAETDAVYDEVVDNMKRPAGPVRLAVPSDLYHAYMWGILGDFARRWPDINLDMTFTQRAVDLRTEAFDLAICVGPLPDSDLKLRKLTTLKPQLYASHDFLRRYPEPKEPKDLKEIPCIGFAQYSNVWTMQRRGETVSVPVKAIHMVNSISISLELVAAGIGIAWLSRPLLKHPAISTEDFVHILPEWGTPEVPISLVMNEQQLPYRVRLFVDFLVSHFTRLAL